MSNARIQFSLASEEVWNAYNPLLKEGEIVTVLKANKKVKLVQGKLGGATYSESTVIWDEDEAQAIMSRTEAAAVTATAQATAASDSASNAAASQSAAAMSATNAKASESAAKNSATSAASSASTASTQAGKAAENARLAEGYKTAAETAKSNASLYAANAKADSEKATASKEAAQSAATTASNFASNARNSASEAKSYRDAANNYAANAKNYSENVNVFLPSVSDSGVLSWTNKAGLANPASVNIKGAKGDKGDTGTAATIKVGTVTTGPAGSAASVVNRGDANNAILDFVLPKGADGKGAVITVNGKAPDAGGNVNIANMEGATSNAAGKAGLVPAPAAGMQNKFLCADATWKDAGGLPVGHEFFTTNPNIPAGCIPLLGGEYSRTAYADLWAWVQTQAGYLLEESAWQAKAAANSGNVPFYSKGDGSSTFRVPALKCLVKGANSIDEVGGYLAAGLPDPNINFLYRKDGTSSGVYVDEFGNDGLTAGISETGGADEYMQSSSASDARTPYAVILENPIYGSSNTVQPPSIVGLWVVKAYGTITNVGSMDVADISTGLTQAETRISALENHGAGATVVESYRNGTEWYRVWSDGWLEQGGQVVKVINGNITFLKAFKYIPTIVTSVLKAYDVQMGGFVINQAVSTTNFSYKTSIWATNGLIMSGYSEDFTWYACGQGA